MNCEAEVAGLIWDSCPAAEPPSKKQEKRVGRDRSLLLWLPNQWFREWLMSKLPIHLRRHTETAQARVAGQADRAAVARQEVEDDRRAVDERTERLRALRQARDDQELLRATACLPTRGTVDGGRA